MDRLDDLIRAYREASRPGDDDVARVRARLAEALGADPDVALLVRGVGEPDPGGVGRVRDRIATTRRTARRRRWLTRAAGGLALAATALLAVTSLVDRGLDQPLGATQGELVTLDDMALRLTVDGEGRVGGTVAHPAIFWERGGLDVAPITGGPERDVEIVTPDGTVFARAQAFAVHRDALGTRVTPTTDAVSVRCGDAETTLLRPGDVAWCLPTTAAGLLGRARTLEAAAAPMAEIVDALDRGLALTAPRDVRGELLATKVRVLGRAGDRPGLLATVQQYLDEGHEVRRAEFEALQRRLR